MKNFEQGDQETPAKEFNVSTKEFNVPVSEVNVPAKEENAFAKEGGKVDFYRLDTSKPYAAEGAASARNFNIMIIIGALFIVGGIVASIITRGQFEENITALGVHVFVCILGAVFLAAGISAQIKNNRKRAAEQSLFGDCILTDGRITEYSCIWSSNTGSDGSSRDTYEVTLTYTFFDEKSNERTGKYFHVYSSYPEFYKGQYLMIAFNSSDSLIMREFTLQGDDMHRFLENEAARSNDDFDFLTGEELDIDFSKPLKAVFGIKSANTFRKIKKNTPYFTYGKLFASEKTYRGNEKEVVYCYIDKWGERHTKVAASLILQRGTQGCDNKVVVAYDAAGNSVVMGTYSLREQI